MRIKTPAKALLLIITFVIVGLSTFLYVPKQFDSSSFFFDKNALQQVIGLIRTSKKQILVEMYSFTHGDVIKELEAKKRAGLDVRVIVDDNPENEALAKARFDVRFEGTPRMFHRKFAIVDEQWIWIGSTNWTYSGFGKNAEVDLLMSSPDHAYNLVRQFEQDWAKAKRRPK